MATTTQRVNELPTGVFDATDLIFAVNTDGTSELVDLYTPISINNTTANNAVSTANSALAQVTALETRVATLESQITAAEGQIVALDARVTALENPV